MRCEDMNYKYLILVFSVLIFTGAGCGRIKWTVSPADGISISTPPTAEITTPITIESVSTTMNGIAQQMKWPLFKGEAAEGGYYWTISPLTLENPQYWFGEKQGNEAPQIKAEKIGDKARFDMYREVHSKPLTKKFLNKENTKVTETLEVSDLKITVLPLGTVLCHEFTEASAFTPNLKMAVLYTSDGWRFGAFNTENCDEAVKYIKMMTDKFTKINK